MSRWTPTALFLALAACGKDAATPQAVGFDWEGGDFDFYTLATTDACLGGALEALFMPEGPDTPHPFEYPVRIPGYDEVPVSYDIDLREPFVGMPVTVDAAEDGTFEVRGSVMPEVELGWAAYGDCAVTMTVDADLLPTDPDTAEGEARIAISDPRGEDERCPVFSSDPCEVDLSLRAVRAE